MKQQDAHQIAGLRYHATVVALLDFILMELNETGNVSLKKSSVAIFWGD